VLEGKTKGYKNHPQLIRFKNTSNPIDAINLYLSAILIEATTRGYHFGKNKIVLSDFSGIIPVTYGQIVFESNHLRKKLSLRDP
jgi:hypothetical protein